MNTTVPASTFSKLLSAAAISAMLAACGGGGGGGGGGGSGSDGGQAPQAPTEDPSTIANTVPVHTYAPGSESAKAFALLNAERVACGFGTVAQNAKLDTAAAGHANYLLLSNSTGHFQNVADAGQPYFTGNGALARATKAGYGASLIIDLQTAAFGTSDLTGHGVLSVRSLLSAPYHMSGMVSSTREVGISIMSSDQTGTTGTFGARTIEQYDFAIATNSSAQLPASSEVLTYPCNGTTGTFFELVNESPNPIPGRDLMANPLGQSVVVQLRDDRTLNITSATMRVNDVNGTQVTLRTPMTRSNDPNSMLQSNQAVIMPDVALLPMTRYYVEIAGTNNGVNFSKSLTFTTGSGTGR